MKKFMKCLMRGDFEAIKNLEFGADDIQSVIDDTEIAIEEDEILLDELQHTRAAYDARIKRTEKRIADNNILLENCRILLEKFEKNEYLHYEE